MIRTTVSDKPEQFTTGNDEKHVGRRVRMNDIDAPGRDIECSLFLSDAKRWVNFVLFQLDYDKGLIFVDPSQLRPYSSEKIEEPKK